MDARKIEAGCARDPEGSARHGRNPPAKLARLVERKTGNIELTVPSCSQKLIVNALRLWEGPGGALAQVGRCRQTHPFHMSAMLEVNRTGTLDNQCEGKEEDSANGQRRVDILSRNLFPTKDLF
jgi:hypothetical protein